LVERDKSGIEGRDQTLSIEDVRRHLEMLDERLDNIDSMVTAVAERVMNQPITLNITCSHCGKNIEITIMGRGKPTA